MSNSGRWCQFNNRNPEFRVRWRRELYSVQAPQLWYSRAVRTAAWCYSSVTEQHSTALRWHWSQAPLWPGISALLCPVQVHSGKMFSVFQCQTATRSLLSWVERGALPALGELTYVDRSTHPWSLIGLSSSTRGLQILTAWLVLKTLSWVIRMEPLWLISEDANGDMAGQLQWDGESLSPIIWNTVPGTPLQGLTQMAGAQCKQAVYCRLLPKVTLA